MIELDEKKSITFKSKLTDAYDTEKFKRLGHELVDILGDYINNVTSGNLKQVLPNTQPNELYKKWNNEFNEISETNPIDLIKQIIEDSNHLHSPKYLGHQVSTPLPFAALCDFTMSLLNNACAVYEMGPVNAVMEKNLIEFMSKLIGFSGNFGGFFTSGGTVGNLTAMLAARQAMSENDIWNDGYENDKNLAVLVSEQSHYSIKRAIQIMGLGEKGIVCVPAKEDYSMNTDLLEETYQKALAQGKKVFAVTANACSTATGSYDDIEQTAKFCEKYKLWLHVDGAHGVSALLSDKYKHLLKGIEKADSVVWDAHKMMMMPALITAVIFKNSKDSFKAFSQKASYIIENQEDNLHDLCIRTMECTKISMMFKLYLSLSIYGKDFFGGYIDKMYDLTKRFAQIIEESDDFELAVNPMSNIICFRYKQCSNDQIDDLNAKIRAKVLERENFYILKTGLRDNTYLRCTIINPLTEESHLSELFEEIREVAKFGSDAL